MKKNNPKAALLGYPVSHSLSPALQNYWLEMRGRDGFYEAIAVADDDAAFHDMLTKLQGEHYAGCNVTLPHKKRAYEAAHEKTERAKTLGVANTLTFKKDKIYADNTDVEGFSKALSAALSKDETPSCALVLGAGGAAPAIILALLECGSDKIFITNRTGQKAKALQRKFGAKLHFVPWEQRSKIVPDADILVNTTTLGMEETPGSPVDLTGAKKSAIIADIIYAPLETALLKQASALGLRHFNGLSMLIYQAIPGFKQWFRARPQSFERTEEFLFTFLQNLNRGPVILGLTGSIGMGKTTTANLFAERGVPVWNADEAVHRLYQAGGKGADLIGARFPDCLEAGAVNRQILSKKIAADKSVLEWLNQTIHPLVYEDEKHFMTRHKTAPAVLLDIPLLFESLNKRSFDAIIVCTAPEAIRRERVLSRPGMSVEKLEIILSQQLSEKARMARADYIIWTHRGLEDARTQVDKVLTDLKEDFPQMAASDW